jgi:hypothetical protein
VAAPVLLALLFALAAGHTLRAVARGRGAYGARWTWAGASAALLSLHLVQEGAERVLAGGGPVDAGMLLVVPLCLAAGALVALGLRESGALLERVLATAPRALRRAAAAVLVPRPPSSGRRAPVARHLAGRAPPALV